MHNAHEQPKRDMNAPRVAFFSDRFPEPSQTFVLSQISGLIDQGLSVRVYATLHSPSFQIDQESAVALPDVEYAAGPAIRTLAIRSGLLGLMARRLVAFLASRQRRRALASSDLAICHFGPIGNSLARLARVHGIGGTPIWTIFHGYDVSSYLQEHGDDVYRHLFDVGDRFFAISEHWMERLRQLGCPPEKTSLLRMGVDCERIGSSVPKSTDKYRILFVGRLVEKKGAEYAIRALAWMNQYLQVPNWLFTIVGDGPLREDLVELVGRLGLADKVSFHGIASSEQVRLKLEQAHIFVLPSVTSANGDKEGIPVALMEAMAAGVPVVSTRHSGIPELIEHGVTGLLSEEREIGGLARNIADLMLSDEKRRTLANSARQKVEQDFNQRLIDREFAELIAERISEVNIKSS